MIKKTDKDIQNEMVLASIIAERDGMILAMNNDLQMLLEKNKKQEITIEELKKQIPKKEE